MALIWISQTITAQPYIIKGQQHENILHEAAEFYRTYAAGLMSGN